MAALPTLYDHYTAGGIMQGLSTEQPTFTLNQKNFTLYGGSMHYFRVHPDYWSDRLEKMRAAGLNTVTTYVPWNLHEPEPGIYDFGNGGTDMQEFLDIERFLKTAQEADMFVVMRPGPFICAEYEFGAFPPWLLREKDIKFRTSDPTYMKHVTRYFNVLLTFLAAFQFVRGGPIIAFQVENEYASTSTNTFKPDLKYVEDLRQLMLDNNITELLFTADSAAEYGSAGSLPTLFQTANFDKNPEAQFVALELLQPGKPLMATEYWAGWFMHWSEQPYEGNVTRFADVYERILSYSASVNLYMFHGGTSWAFLNGANINGVNQSTLQPDITSYDYDAPLTEYGNYTEKYYVVKQLLEQYNPVKTYIPEPLEEPSVVTLPSQPIESFILYEDVISQIPYRIPSTRPISMENLPINNNTGQKFGYIVYRKTIDLKQNSTLLIKGFVRDTVNVYINGKRITDNIDNLDAFGYWKKENSAFIIPTSEDLKDATLDLVICNIGRNNFGKLGSFYQYKGLTDDVYINDQVIENWIIIPIEFKRKWLRELTGWKPFEANNKYSSLGFYKAQVCLNETADTFVDTSNWKKGVVVINDFVLGRHWTIGPQQQLYLPAPLLKIGCNDIIIFEEFYPDRYVSFTSSRTNFNNKN